jgi:hypothetical protein
MIADDLATLHSSSYNNHLDTLGLSNLLDLANEITIRKQS